MPRFILGISGYYHDSAACLLRDGQICAAAQEERFVRQKHYSGFPACAVKYCLREGKIDLEDLEGVAFYDKPLLKFERLLETFLAFAPRGFKVFITAMPLWVREKLFLKSLIEKELLKIDSGANLPPLLFSEHHEAHAASAFYPSPFSSAAVLCLDGVGEWATTSTWKGESEKIYPLWEMSFPHSLGLLYAAFTYFTGFEVNSGEYKVMGLAPYGRPKYVQKIYDSLIDLKPDGTFRLDMQYFNYCTGLTMTNSRFDKLFDGPRRESGSTLTQREMDLARSIQEVTEEVMLRLARTLHRETGDENLCLAGGVALNCVGNGRILREGPFKQLWIQPAAGDAGGALGAALMAWHGYKEQPRRVNKDDLMRGSLLGPAFTNEQIRRYLSERGILHAFLEDSALFNHIAAQLAEGKIVGWFQGRMEFGPRALGARSILADARNPAMQSMINKRIKHRESFRPFAPSVLREFASDYFELDCDSPYMLLVSAVRPEHRVANQILGTETPHSDIPAVTHVDYSARIQTVAQETNPRYYSLLAAFLKATGCAVLLNTSFNVRDEPMVCSPEDAYRCFMGTEMDVLVMENCVLYKSAQLRRDSGDTPERATNLFGEAKIGHPVTKGTLRYFGLIFGSVFLIISLLSFFFDIRQTCEWSLVLALLFILAGLFSPTVLSALYRGWMKATTLLGRINSSIILALTFLLIVIPMGIFFRLMKRDLLRLRTHRDVRSYRITRASRTPSHLEHQF
jgi:carbamoyltransferase